MHGCQFVGQEGLGGRVDVVLKPRVAHPIHPIPKNKKDVLRGRCEDAHPVEDVKPCGYSGLIHGFTLSTTTDSNNQYPVCGSVLDMRYVACGERPLKNK